MKKFSPVVSQLIKGDFYRSFLMLEIGPTRANNWFRMVGMTHDIVFDGNTYTSQDMLCTIDPPKLSTVVDREAYKVSLADANFTLRPFMEEGITNATLTVRVGFLNTTADTIGGVEPGDPFLNPVDTVIGYRGMVDTYSYIVGTEGDVKLVIEGASPMGALGLTRSIITSKEWMNQRYPSDTSYDQTYIGSSQIMMKWGKA